MAMKGRKRPFRSFDEGTDEEIDLDTQEVVGPREKKIGARYKELLAWAIRQRGGAKFTSIVKQYAAMKRMRVAGISPTQVQERWLELFDDPRNRFGVDFAIVANSFDRKPPPQ